MTLHLADMATYQGTLTPADLWRGGIGIANWKVGHGLTQRAVRAGTKLEVAAARAIGMRCSSFHFLTGDSLGADQAKYVYNRLIEYGLATDAVHVVDIEWPTVGSEATQAIARDYITTMQSLLKRPIMVYTARSYWLGKGWNVSDLTPYLHAPAGAGTYPGDDSPVWAGFGSWQALTCMQYSVAPWPTMPSIKVSKSAVRDVAAWDILTKGSSVSAWVLVPSLVALRSEFNKVNPNRDKGADGSIGDASHTSSSDHTPDEDSSILRDHDADSKNEVHALDVDSTGGWPGTTFSALVQKVIAGEKAKWLSATDVCRLEYVIWNRRIYSRIRDFAPVDYTGPDPHTNHAHFSARYLTRSESDTRPWGVAPVAAPPVQPPKEQEVAYADDQHNVSGPAADALGIAAGSMPLQTYMNILGIRVGQTSSRVVSAVATLNAILANVVADDQDLAQTKAAIKESEKNVITGLAAAEMPADQIADALRVALGDRAAEVGQLLVKPAS